MSFGSLDPNGYATGAQAASVLARAKFELNDVEHARKRREFASEALEAAKQRFLELEAAYKEGKVALEEAASYDQLASQQLDASLARLAEVKAPLHPIRKTPLELLGSIFAYCWEPLPEGTLISERQADIRTRQRQPFRLAAVCRRWRTASLSCPNAWSCIELRVDDYLTTNSKAWRAYIACLLGRSATVALHIRIYRARSHQARDTKLVQPLAENMFRCGTLFISASAVNRDDDALVPLLTTATPLLSALHLKVAGDTEFLQQLAIFPHVPRLHTMRTSFPFAAGQTSMPGVTFAALYSPTVSNTEDIVGNTLGICPNLKDLYLRQYEPLQIPNAQTAAKTVSNSVRKLFIELNTAAANGSAFSHRYAFPHLAYLVIYGLEQGSAARMQLVHSLIADGAPGLLELDYSTIAENDIEPFLRGLGPAVKLYKLTLSQTNIGHQWLERLCHALGTASADNTWLCPNLTTLNLRKCTLATDCMMVKLVELVDRRNRAAAKTEDAQRPKRLLSVVLPACVDPTIRSQIADLLNVRAQ